MTGPRLSPPCSLNPVLSTSPLHHQLLRLRERVEPALAFGAFPVPCSLLPVPFTSRFTHQLLRLRERVEPAVAYGAFPVPCSLLPVPSTFPLLPPASPPS